MTKRVPTTSLAFTHPTIRLFQVEPNQCSQVCPKPTSLGKAALAGPPPAKQLQEGEVFWSPSKGLTLQPLLLLTTS